MSPTLPLGVGVIGVGAIGRCHAQNVAASWPRAKLVAVSDPVTSRAEAIADSLGCDAMRSLEELLGRRDLQAVIVAAPPETHAQLLVAAAREGKHILCEKPLAGSSVEARGAIEACRRAGVSLQLAFMRRYDPEYAQAKRSIESGRIGQPLVFNGISRDAQAPDRSFFTSAAASNPLIESAGHDFDLARWLMQDEIQSVTAVATILTCHDLSDVQPMDFAQVTVRFAGGGMGSVQIYKNSGYGYDIRTEVVGTAGRLLVGKNRQARVMVAPSGPNRGFPQHWLDRFALAYRSEVFDWIDRVATGRAPAITGEDGLRALLISEAADESVRTGGEVVVG